MFRHLPTQYIFNLGYVCRSRRMDGTVLEQDVWLVLLAFSLA